QIIRFTKGKVRREKVPSAEEVEEKRTNAFLETLRETLEKGEYKRQDGLIDQLLEAGHSPTDIASALLHLLGGDKPAAQAIVEEPPRREFRESRDRGFEDRPARDYPKYGPLKKTRARADGNTPPREHTPSR